MTESTKQKDWKSLLSPEAYRVLRESGTERPFSGQFNDHWEPGIYGCGACHIPLFKSDAKFDAGCGWPSFFEPCTPDPMKYIQDQSHGMVRTEVRCGNCDSHLGHIFNDGPPPTGQRYCMNSVALQFTPAAR